MFGHAGLGLHHLARALNGSSLGRVTRLDISHCGAGGEDIKLFITDCTKIVELRCYGVFEYDDNLYHCHIGRDGELADEDLDAIQLIMDKRPGGAFMRDDETYWSTPT